jgi:hypothetical protein
MSVPFRSPRESQAGHASPPLLLAAPIVGLLVSVGLNWITGDPVPGAGDAWLVAAALLGTLLAIAAAAAAAVWLRRGGSPSGPAQAPVSGLILSALGALILAGGIAFFAVQMQDPVEMTADALWIVSLVVGLLVALVALVVLFTILRRRSQ